MKYFLDTEFHEYEIEDKWNKKRPTIDLISIGIVAEDGREFYRISNEFNLSAALNNQWLKDNVIKPIYKELAPENKHDEFGYWGANDYIKENTTKSPLVKCNSYIKDDILEFIGEDKKPEFWAYYADYDWVVFCWLFGRMIDLPKHFPMYCNDIKQLIKDRDISKQWIETNLPNPKAHNALADAKWNKELFELIQLGY